MFRKFFQYYLLIIFSLFVVVLCADYLFQQYQKKHSPIEVDISHLVELVQEYCSAHQCEAGQATPFSKVSILARNELGLSQKSLKQLSDKQFIQIIINSKQAIYYANINADLLMKLDVEKETDSLAFHWYTTAFYLLLGGGLFFVLYPLFKDMFSLKQAAVNFAKNRQFEELSLPSSTYFQPVNDAFQWMALKITRLIALQKELSDTLSHELRTSISRISFSLATLDKSNVEETKQELQQDVNELKLLVEEYLSFSKQEHATPTLDLQEQSLIPIIEHHVKLLGQYSNKDIVLNYLLEVEIPVDRRAIARAIKNLIDNAIKYSRTRVSIELFVDGEFLVFQIEDDGEGVDCTEIDSLLLPYSRATKAKNISGYGLGLAITRKIIDWHRGEIKVTQSQTLSGACFQIKLPLVME